MLDAVRLGRATTRAALIQATGLGRSVVEARLSDLLGRGLLIERSAEPSTVGRPPRRVAFRGDAGRLLVADLGATSIDVADVDLAGRILARHAEPADIASGPEAILGRVEVLWDRYREAVEDAGRRIWGIGIAVPGPVEFRTGRPVSRPIMPGWEEYPLRERLAQRFGAPVWVDNDVNVMALGEWRAGAARGYQDVVFVKLGTGIGAGVIADGTLHRGAQGTAGEVGHLQVTDDPSATCRCGNVGCLEALAGGGAIARGAELAARNGQSPLLAELLRQHGRLTPRDVARAAGRGDQTSIELIQRTGRLVGVMLATVVDFFNPSLIVIGGGVARAGDALLATIRETVYRRSLPVATRDLVVTTSTLGDRAGVTGIATMVLDGIFARDSLARWLDAGEPFAPPEVAWQSP